MRLQKTNVNISEILKKAAYILEQNGIAQPRREAASLLAFSLQKDKTFLIAHSDYRLSNKEETRFLSFLERRASREPFQHITGIQEFYGLEFFVTKDVLIPRHETEIIVENAIKILREMKNPRFCEIGIGSGCISVSILNEVKTATAIGLDISEKALEIAEENAKFHCISDRLILEKSDVFENIRESEMLSRQSPGQRRRYDFLFDLIVSNPPYIPQADFENLQPEVRNFDPQNALTDGKDGLTIIRKIVEKSPDFLKPNSVLLMEIGINQADTVEKMFSTESWETVEILPDLQNIPRTVKARKSEKVKE